MLQESYRPIWYVGIIHIYSNTHGLPQPGIYKDQRPNRQPHRRPIIQHHNRGRLFTPMKIESVIIILNLELMIMAATKAQQSRRRAKAVYGKQIGRGNAGERRAARTLRRQGYSVSFNRDHPQGLTDLTARRAGRTKRIQVKNITSRNLETREAARHRIAGKPFGLKQIPAGLEVWVYDKSNHLYKFTK